MACVLFFEIPNEIYFVGVFVAHFVWFLLEASVDWFLSENAQPTASSQSSYEPLITCHREERKNAVSSASTTAQWKFSTPIFVDLLRCSSTCAVLLSRNGKKFRFAYCNFLRITAWCQFRGCWLQMTLDSRICLLEELRGLWDMLKWWQSSTSIQCSRFLETKATIATEQVNPDAKNNLEHW